MIKGPLYGNTDFRPAFPSEAKSGDGGSIQYAGMTLRDYFAAKALEGMMASRNPNSPRFHPDDDAKFCYEIADAMIKAGKL